MHDAVSTAEGSRWGLSRPTFVALGLLGVLLLYCFWSTLAQLGVIWGEEQYSHGWLVPIFAVALLWLRWDPSLLQSFESVPSAARWCGIGLLAASLSARVVFAYYMDSEVLDMYCFLPSLAGVVLLVGGWKLFVWAGPVIAFLVFMFPLPYNFGQATLTFLQGIASRGAVYVLQMIGYPAHRENYLVWIGESSLNVAEACAGLRMLTVFLALTASVALVYGRRSAAGPSGRGPAQSRGGLPLENSLTIWERLFIFLSGVPIALASNILRITVTGIAKYHLELALGKAKGLVWSERVHEWAGLAMMVPAIGLLYLEIVVLNHLFVERPRVTGGPSPIGGLGWSGRKSQTPSGGRHAESLMRGKR